MTFQWTGNNPINIDSDFTVVLIRHCESCSNVIPKRIKINPFHSKWRTGVARAPLCTSLGIKQTFRAGFILPLVLQHLGLKNNLLWFSSILPRAIESSLLASSSFISSTNSGKNNPIYRVAYIKEACNNAEKMLRKIRSQRFSESANITSLEVSDTYIEAMKSLFQEYNIETKPISKDTDFIDDIYPVTRKIQENMLKNKKKIFIGCKCSANTIKKPMSHKKLEMLSDYKTFERDVLPLLVHKSKSMGFKGIVLFTHGKLITQALAQPWLPNKLHPKNPLPKSKRDNLSMHCIKYKFDGTTDILGKKCPKLKVINTFPNIDLHILHDDIPLRYKYNEDITSDTKKRKRKKLGKASLSGKTNLYTAKYEGLLRDDMVTCNYKFHKQILARATRKNGGNRRPNRFTRKNK
tara:strand:- start:202 stop:1425 length:1224 start_codon:yes stop_codon:yes gene_type:complete